jgi:hypothetical protein
VPRTYEQEIIDESKIDATAVDGVDDDDKE